MFFNSIKFQIKDIEDGLKTNGYHILRGAISHEICLAARNEYFTCMKKNDLHAQSEAFTPIEILDLAWRKTAVGSGNGVGEQYSQVLQTTYLPINESNLFKNLHYCMKAAIQLRNLLTNMDEDFGVNNYFESGTYWNASRVHHYPSGGGHMSEHSDTHFPAILNKSNIPFVQVAVLLSNRQEDFHQGGGFIIDRNNKKIFFEDESILGSIVVFDGSLKHGVDDIDPNCVIDWDSNKGRIALFSNLYVSK